MEKIDLHAGARTVVNVADQFDRLRSEALQLLGGFTASNRGYFTPSEDEETKHLLVSYWHSRNALVDLVRAFYYETDGIHQLRPAKFLVAYAGALVMVDAARFLRQHVEDRPIVRAKLNEAEPQFGIPTGTYDLVQHSLTRPIHAWHLYNAARYFETSRSELESVAKDHQVTELMPIILKYQDRIGVSISDFSQARLRVRFREADSLMRRDVLGRALYGIQRAVSQLISGVYTKSNHFPNLVVEAATQLRAMLCPGDILVTRKEFAMTNYFLPGYWPHAALYVGSDQDLTRLGLHHHEHFKPRWKKLLDCDTSEPRRVLEALKDGVQIRSLASPFASDALLVLRPKLTEDDIGRAIARGMFHESKPYDFDFDFTRSDRLVCTEVVYRSYEKIGGIAFALTRRAGRMTLSAEDLIRMALERTHFELKAVAINGKLPTLAVDALAESIVRQTLGTAPQILPPA